MGAMFRTPDRDPFCLICKRHYRIATFNFPQIWDLG